MRNSRGDSRKGDKMLDKYLGPYEVVEVKNKGLYEIKNLKTGKRLAKMVNVARLKVFKGTNFTLRKQKKPLMDKVSNQNVDKVESKTKEGNETFDHSVLTSQLYCPHYLRLWRTGAAEHCYRAEEDAHFDVGFVK